MTTPLRDAEGELVTFTVAHHFEDCPVPGATSINLDRGDDALTCEECGGETVVPVADVTAYPLGTVFVLVPLAELESQ